MRGHSESRILQRLTYPYRTEDVRSIGALHGQLSEQTPSFKQMFVISHVDDVRSSPVFDELWRIEETADGGSRITSLAAGTEIEAI